MSQFIEAAAAQAPSPVKRSRLVLSVTGWCFTLNNPDEYPVLAPGVQFLEYQEERGDSGTLHLQGYVEFAKRTKLAECKLFLPRAHFEQRRGTPTQALDYVRKPTFAGAVRYSRGKLHAGKHAVFSTAAPGYAAFVACLRSGGDVRGEHLGQYLRHKRAADEYLREERAVKRADIIVPAIVLREWQARLLQTLDGDPDPRTVHWYYDTRGGSGKSTFCNYLVRVRGVVVMESTARERVVRAYSLEPVVLFDIERAAGMEGACNYGVLEMLKNGRGFNTMYEPGMKVWKIPHVVVFSNFPPDQAKLSADRWHIVDITLPADQEIPDDDYDAFRN